MKTLKINTTTLLIFFVLITFQMQAQFVKQYSGTSSDLNAVNFLSDRMGYACGDKGTFVKTTTGGDYWYTLDLPTTAKLNGVLFTSADTGFIIGNDNTFLKTVNGGLSWDFQELKYECNLTAIRFVNNKTGYIIGHGPKGGLVMKTNDRGRTWVSSLIVLQQHDLQQDPSAEKSDVYLNCFSFLDKNTGLIGGFSYSYVYGKHPFICKTEDGGKTFTNISPEIITNDWYIGKEVVSVSYLNTHDACAVMNTGNGPDFLLISNYKVKSFDKGESSPYFNFRGRFYSASFLDRFTAYFTGIVDGNSQVIKTIDQGRSFIKLKPPVSKSLYASTCTNANHVYFVGQDGTILKFDDDNNTILEKEEQPEEVDLPYTLAATKDNLKKTHVHVYNVNQKSRRNFSINLYDVNGKIVDVKKVRTRVFSDEVRLWVRTATDLDQSIYFYTVKYNNEAVVSGKINRSNYAQLSF